MKIVITPSELIERGRWGEACELLGINEWAVNEGLVDGDEELTLSEEQAAKLGILPGPRE